MYELISSRLPYVNALKLYGSLAHRREGVQDKGPHQPQRCTQGGQTPVGGLRRRWPALPASQRLWAGTAGTLRGSPSPRHCHSLGPSTRRCGAGDRGRQSRLLRAGHFSPDEIGKSAGSYNDREAPTLRTWLTMEGLPKIPFVEGAKYGLLDNAFQVKLYCNGI